MFRYSVFGPYLFSYPSNSYDISRTSTRAQPIVCAVAHVLVCTYVLHSHSYSPSVSLDSSLFIVQRCSDCGDCEMECEKCSTCENGELLANRVSKGQVRRGQVRVSNSARV